MNKRFINWLVRSQGAGLAATAMAVLLLAGACAPPPEQPTVQEKPEPKAAAEPKPEPQKPDLPDVDLENLPGRVHIVQAGDTLYSLAEKYYGHGRHYQKILMANRKRLTDPNDLPVGMKLIIP